MRLYIVLASGSVGWNTVDTLSRESLAHQNRDGTYKMVYGSARLLH